mmetsp:Transcript_39184/g.34872  ORF Transcript_39184/g.34872 Transcript_39184/m.34872 type:complete len:166 (-) Transcript_39184:708-1205(-)
MNDVLTTKELSENPKLGEDALYVLGHYALIKFFMIALTFACNLAFGILGPPMTLGAVVGRLFAEIGEKFGWLNPTFKGAYAVVGSAACVSCIIRGIAPLAIMIETTGQIEYATPIMVGVIVAFMIGNQFSLSFFDVAVYIRKLPLMGSLMTKEHYELYATDVLKE